MKKYAFFIIVTLFAFTRCGNSKKIRNLEHVVVNDIFMVYDSTALRIPGRSFKIGIGIIAQKDSIKDTLLFTTGFKEGSLLWSNFKIKTFGCEYSNGKIFIPEANWPEKGYFSIDVEVKSQPQRRCYLSFSKNYITKTELISQNAFNRAPGNNIKLGVVKYYDNGAREVLMKKGEVDKYLSLCHIYVTGGEYRKGTFKITDDIFKIENNLAGIVAQPIAEPSLADTFDIQLDYIDNYVFTIYGHNGENGYSGRNGINGASATCYGCNGYDGQNGEHGSPGQNGERGHDAAIDFDVYYDSLLHTDLCMVRIEDLMNGYQKYYIVNPKGGTLKFSIQGGSGGSGGNGGSGGSGGNGAPGEIRVLERKKTITYTDSAGTHNKEIIETYTVTYPGGNGGYGGIGGFGGDGGLGGDGGDIYVYYSKNSQSYLNRLILRSMGGSGGISGFGGFGGSGGAGGTGNPSGSNGDSGYNGSSGWMGGSGRSGSVNFVQKE